MKIFRKKVVDQKSYTELVEQNKALRQEVQFSTEFVKKLGSGQLDAKLEQSNFQDSTLIKALFKAQEHLANINLQEEERNWTTSGLAKFADILRDQNHEDTDENYLYNQIISNLVKYINANQGALFVLNTDDENNKYLEMLSCYAYERKKHMEKKVEIGEGMVGQIFLEARTTYLTEIPNNYLEITSGLGKASPKYLVIVPLKINEEVFGVLEIASFFEIKEFQISFLEKLGENIASAIANAKNIIRTRKLLRESQIQSEELRTREEEMRQNMEELEATQEEMQRKQQEVEKVNLKMKRSEATLLKALESAKAKEEEVMTKQREIAEQEGMIKEQEDVFKEMMSEMEEKEKELDVSMKKLENNQQVLMKASKKNREKEQQYKREIQEKTALIEDLKAQLAEKNMK